jgi:hypothetical protein
MRADIAIACLVIASAAKQSMDRPLAAKPCHGLPHGFAARNDERS